MLKAMSFVGIPAYNEDSKFSNITGKQNLSTSENLTKDI
jgi:hypothetical protein